MRSLLKTLLPEPVRLPLRRTETWLRRLSVWLSAMRDVEGLEEADRRILRQSFLASPRTAARDIDVWQDPQILADIRVAVRGVGRFSVRAGSDDFYHVLPVREPAIMAAMRARLRPGDLFVDAGANIGFYTVLAGGLVGPGGRVIAVEMMPDTAQILRGHVQLNGLANVTVVERALSDAAGGTVEAMVVPGHFGQASIAVDRPGAKRVAVPTTTLDALLADAGEVALMKMDLEGAEVAALAGARQLLPRIRAIVFEQLRDQPGPAALLAEAGFAITALDGNNHLAARDAR